MFRSRITLFHIAGLAVRIDASWIFLVVLVTWSLAVGFFPMRYHGLAPRTYWIMGAIGAIGLFASILFHELCHSIVARRRGVPMKGITLFIFGGVAEMEGEPDSAGTELLTALAGPLATAALVLVLWPIALIATNQGWPVTAAATLNYLATINLVLLLFNLVPAFPLDGGRLLRAALWRWKDDIRWATRIASEIGSGFGVVLIALGIVRILAGDFLGGMWSALIGTFLRNAAAMSYQQVVLRESLRGSNVRRFMKSDVITVPREISLSDLVENYFYKYHFKMFPVLLGETLVGCISTREVAKVPREEWSRQTVGAVAVRCTPENSVPPDMDAIDALARMNRTGASRLLVTEGDRLVGILTLKDLLRFLSMKIELEERRAA